MSAMRWFWLGYTDEEQPKGWRSMGCVIIQATTDDIAKEQALDVLGVEPGWTCNVGEIAADWGDPPLIGYTLRLLNREQAEHLAKEWDPGHAGLADPDDIAAAFSDDSAPVGAPLFRGRR